MRARRHLLCNRSGIVKERSINGCWHALCTQRKHKGSSWCNRIKQILWQLESNTKKIDTFELKLRRKRGKKRGRQKKGNKQKDDDEQTYHAIVVTFTAVVAVLVQLLLVVVQQFVVSAVDLAQLVECSNLYNRIRRKARKENNEL